MNSGTSIRTVLMSADIKPSGPGFHRLVFKVELGRGGISQVTVLISQDAHRKLASQLARVKMRPGDTLGLLKTWARWELEHRVQDLGVVPSSLTITASDLDDLGAYAMDLGRLLHAV
jgi:hypothetical protein